MMRHMRHNFTYKTNPVNTPDPITGIRAYIPGMINQSNYRISQDGLVLWC